MARLSNILRNFAVFVDGVAKAGDGAECQLPNIEEQTEEFLGGGMYNPIAVPLSGNLLEASFKLTSFDPDVIAFVARRSGNDIPFTFRGSVTNHEPGNDAAPIAVIARMNARIHSMNFGGWKVGDKAENECSLHVNRYVLRHGDRELIKIDPLNFIWAFDGVNQREGDRIALGL